MTPSDDRAEHILPRFSLNRRVTVLVLLATTLVVGVIATLGIPLELIPRGFDDPSLFVFTQWQDAPAEEILEKITQPMEEELSTVAGLQDVYSFATTGFSRWFLRFKQGTDMDVAYREVRDRIERAKARLPDDVERVQIRKHDDAAIPVFMMGLAIDPQATDVYNLIQNEIVLPLQRIDGVADVETRGLMEKEVLIELDRERVASAGLNIYQLGQELGSDNFTLASGHVRASGKKLLLRSLAKYPDLEALENRMVGPSVRLKDVATVTYDVPEQKFRVRANSMPAVMILVMKEGEANALEVTDRVSEAVERMDDNPRLALIGREVFFSQGKTIRESLGIMVNSGRIGAIFAAFVLLFFLRRFRMTIIITLSIPLSILIGLVAMYFSGETLNILTLLGLMISVGLLVDNSVVVAENIFRLHKDGLGRREAVIRGAGEISLAIVMATLTTIIVFLPVSLVEGQGQFFLLRLAIPITVSLLASLAVALVFVPLSVYLTLPKTLSDDDRPTFTNRVHHLLHRAYDTTFERINHGYNRMLAVFLRRRMDLVVVTLVIFALTMVGFDKKWVKLVDVQDEDRTSFEIDVVLPQSTTLEEAEEYFQEVEKTLETMKAELDLDGYFIFHREAYGEVNAWFNNPRTNDVSPRAAIDRFLEEMPEKAGSRRYTGLESDDEKESKAVQMLNLRGDDASQLEKVASNLEELLLGIDGVIGIKRSGDLPTEELGLTVDRERTQRLGVNPEVVAGVVRNSLGGRALPKFYREGREIPVRIRFQEEDREGLAELFDFQVPTDTGEAVPLSAVTTPQRLEATKRIWRRNKETTRTITLELDEDKAQETRGRVMDFVAGLDLPEGVTFGEAQRNSVDEEAQAMLFAMKLSVVFIYLLMGFLFESFVLPLSILPTIPLAIVGVFWTHFFLGYDLDPLGLVGLVILVGVVVNNGIVLIDYVNRLRHEGEPRARAVLLAADRRFRPIMMTALTTICGMVPLTLAGTTSIGLSYKSFGLTLIGGMATATLLTLLVVPVAYTLFDDLRGWALALRGRFRAGRESSPAALPPATEPDLA